MHEVAVAASLYEWALEQARALAPRRILAIELQQDGQSCLNPVALSFGFQAIAASTVLEGVRLDFTEVQPEYRCPDCGESKLANHPPARCPGCGRGPLRLMRESSLRVRSIEVE